MLTYHGIANIKAWFDQTFTDTFLNIEGVIGSIYNDIITGNDQNNILEGAEGNDIIYGGEGDDILVTIMVMINYTVKVEMILITMAQVHNLMMVELELIFN